MLNKNDGFKTSFKRIKETGRLSKLGRRLQLRHIVGITIQIGESNASVQSQSQIRTIAFTTIGEVIRFKASKVAKREARSGTD